MILPNLKAAFFDFDGTLADTFDCLEQTHQRVMEKLGVPSPKKAGWFHDYFGKERTFIYNSLYGADKAEEARAIFTDYVRNHSADLVRPLEGAEDILKFLQAHGIPMTIVTNKAYDIVIKEIEAFGWNHYFPRPLSGQGMRRQINRPPRLSTLPPSALAIPANPKRSGSLAIRKRISPPPMLPR